MAEICTQPCLGSAWDSWRGGRPALDLPRGPWTILAVHDLQQCARRWQDCNYADCKVGRWASVDQCVGGRRAAAVCPRRPPSCRPRDHGKWHMLQECGTSEGVWEVFLYAGSSATEWRVRAGPLRTLQRHSRSMFGGCHIATVGEYTRTATSTILNCDTLYRAYGLSAPMLLTQL
jgi:hypothetical protein